MTALAPLGFGPEGWGAALLLATGMTLAVSVCAFFAGLVFGTMGAAAKLSGGPVLRSVAGAYTTILRGIPDLLVIYLFYFGGSAAMTQIATWLGGSGFFGLNGFMVGVLAVGIVSGAYQTEVLRGAYSAIPRGEIEAARVAGMGPALMLRRITGPLALRTALPGMGNVWQMVLKESALISVTGLVDLMRQTEVAAGSTRLPFLFYATAACLYLVLTTISATLFRGAERSTRRGMARA
ncbi:ABC transporter permease [Acidisphaera sp. L21]|uniref:ABC transporter permease n=1 Tax=Acidisphaera sp. L21 TaxID=1641851 RepID=UPI00131A96B3|nr:ABC transporter permease subunit [Acidisphaera sp. L21]